ncbi:MAG: protein kinase [Acidobacteriota bacterium]|nr:MAG: protein kinase [Acidobacteriota bacterium]
MIGEKLSYFQITSKLGEGGMGEVWEATDTKLNRQVALKVLPEVFSNDIQRMGRFQREAQVLASLNHPNIAGIYGLEEADGKNALVMELVEGEDLSDRIARGPIPLVDALRLALQVAEALEAAHEKGIIHRDLKPANIKVRPDGSVKVLDFGLAKALEGDPQTQANLTQSPTISMAATQAGIILGTAGYMSPEQARGQAVDKRADIWAFGVILYEMLTGRVAFTGDTISDVMASVLKIDLDWSKLPEETPSPVRRLLRRCLEGQPKQRLHDIADARIEIEQYLSNPIDEKAQVTEQRATGFTWGQKLALAGALVTVAAVCTVIGFFLSPSESLREPVRVAALLEGEQPFFLGQGSAAVLSPDGSNLVFATGRPGNNSQLFLRPMDSTQSQVLKDTENSYNPFFSPDGKWIGFVTLNELKKVSVSGGTPLVLCTVSRSRGAAWGESGTIVLARESRSGLSQVSAAGGEPQELTTLAEGELTHRWPQFLPGSRWVLFTAFDKADPNSGRIEVVSVETGERKVVWEGGTYGRYLSSGHLVYINASTMFAAPFDPETFELKGMPAPVEQSVSMSGNGGAHFDVSSDGTLVYLTGEQASIQRILVEVDQEGDLRPVTETKRAYRWLRISPNNRYLAVEILEEGQFDIWIHDLERDTQTRLTFSDGPDIGPLWSQDGQFVYFGSQRDGKWGVFRKRSDGAGGAERLTEEVGTTIPYGMAPDNNSLAYHVNDRGTIDIWILPTQEEGAKPFKLFEGDFREYDAVFSPDGKWIAYESDESQRTEVYIRPSVPGPGGKWQVSTAGGQMPRYSQDGRTLYFLGLDYSVWEVPLTATADAVNVGRPSKLFDRPANLIAEEWEVTPDGKRFFFILSEGSERQTSGPNVANFTFNWYTALERLLDAGQ